jgi:hypothetical protein
MIYKVVKTKRNPYLGELYTDLRAYQEIKMLAEETGDRKVYRETQVQNFA